MSKQQLTFAAVGVPANSRRFNFRGGKSTIHHPTVQVCDAKDDAMKISAGNITFFIRCDAKC